MFEQLAHELNDRGMYISRVIKTESPWNKDRIKELLWRPTQETMLGKKSTTQLTTREIDEVFEVIHKAMTEKGVDLMFPSIETIINQQRLNDSR